MPRSDADMYNGKPCWSFESIAALMDVPPRELAEHIMSMRPRFSGLRKGEDG